MQRQVPVREFLRAIERTLRENSLNSELDVCVYALLSDRVWYAYAHTDTHRARRSEKEKQQRNEND